MHHALQLVVATHERIELPVHRSLSEVARKLSQQTRLTLPLLRRRFLLRHAGQLVANLRQLQAALLQNLRREALLFAQQTEQQMLSPDVLVSQPLRFFRRVSQHSLAFVRERQVDAGRHFFTNGGMRLDLLPNGFDRRMRAQETVG